VTIGPATGQTPARRRRRRSGRRGSGGAVAPAPRPEIVETVGTIEPGLLDVAPPPTLPDDDPAPTDRVSPTFAHASEAEMARILDFYRITWEYEPHTFPILWNLDGEVTESFSPDFWLPDLDLYLEMTTLRQKLVRKKNRKLRRIRDLYPDLRIKLFYARDFRALMLKFGRLALVDALSGSSGQVVPDRAMAETVLEASDEAGVAPAAADRDR
jgi:hypoxanthine phosphoribosyltransferase